MATLNPYLNFNGNAEEAFHLYKSVFGGEMLDLNRFGEMPDSGNLPEADKKKIMHLTFRLPNGQILMASDVVEGMGHKISFGSNIYLSIVAESKTEADHVFSHLSKGGKIEMPIADTFWGAYFGMCEDRFGMRWMINYDYPKN